MSRGARLAWWVVAVSVWALTGTAFAQDTPTIELRPDAVEPGGALVVTGEGWDGDCRVDLALDTVEGPALGSAFPDDGEFEADAVVPADTAPGAHTVVATGHEFGVEFCGGPSGTRAEADLEVLAPEAPGPVLQLDALEGVPGSTVEMAGTGFCSQEGCSPVDVYVGGRLAAADIAVDGDGGFVADVTIPAVSPVGEQLVIASQTDQAGEDIRAFGEFYTKVRPEGARPDPGGPPAVEFTAPPARGGSSSSGGSGTPTGGSATGVGLATLALGVGLLLRSRVVALAGSLLAGIRQGLGSLGARVAGWSARPAGGWLPRHPPRGLRSPLAYPAMVAGFVAVTLGLALLPAMPVPAAPPPSAVTDVNPDGLPGEPRFGGRALGLTVHPTDASTVWVASELGGLWRSSDGGTNWSHEDDVPLTISRDISFDPQDASVLVASGRYDGGATNNGGIWRSTDGGTTWAKPATSNPACITGADTWGIAIPDDAVAHTNVYVGTDCGVALSTDSGGSWTHTDPCPAAAGCGAGGTVYDVEARVVGGDVQLDVCGDEGFFRSTDGGATWSAPDPNSPAAAPPNRNPCHVATAPGDADTVYLANWSGVNASGFCVSQLNESTGGGQPGTWVSMDVTASNCRDAWVVTAPDPGGDPDRFDVYFGSSQRVLRQNCDLTATPRCATGAGNWPTADSGAHADPSDLAFDPADPSCPIVLSTDGGMSTSGDCGATWVDGNRGYHALDIRGLAGAVHGGHTDLYIGTQDNGLYASQDNAATWARPVGADAYNVYADSSRVLYRRCFGCNNFIADAHVAGAGAFNDPPDNIGTTAAATQFGPQSYAFVTSNNATPAQWRVWVTTDEGANWSQMGPVLPGNPGEIRSAGPSGSPTFFVRLNAGGQRRLYRLTGALDTTATLAVASPAGTWISRAWAVDPADPTLLYATDLNGQQMLASTDSGATWTPDTALADLVTQDGDFPFLTNKRGAQVSAVALDPSSPAVLVGTRTAGSAISLTDGASWVPVPGGGQLPLYRDAFFDPSDGAVYVATQGRGIWRLDLPSVDLSVDKTDSPDPVAAGTPLTYTIEVDNAGPDTANETRVVDTLPSEVSFVSTDLAGGCTEAPAGTLTCEVGDLAPGSTSFAVTVEVDHAAVHDNGGPLTITNTATVSSLVPDVDASNDTATVDTLVVAVADLEILSYSPVDAPDQIIVGQPVDVLLRKVFTNNGPSWPMDVSVAANASGSPGVTVSPDVLDLLEDAVALDEERVVDEQFTLSCDEASAHSFTFVDEIAPADAADTDPDLSNNTAEATLDVVCVVPVQINIKPGSDPNSINTGKGTVSVAILTTTAGEYGLPLAFDATTVDPLSVRFGPADVVFDDLGGATETHDRGHLQDSRELDETTRDGDTDMVLHFRAADTGLDGSHSEACVKGTWVDGGGEAHVFFGCDAVRMLH